MVGQIRPGRNHASQPLPSMPTAAPTFAQVLPLPFPPSLSLSVRILLNRGEHGDLLVADSNEFADGSFGGGASRWPVELSLHLIYTQDCAKLCSNWTATT